MLFRHASCLYKHGMMDSGPRFSSDRSHPKGVTDANPGCISQPAGRLNLLLSFAGWQPDPWINRIGSLLEPMGVSSFHADTGRRATDVIRTTPIHIAVVDLALPLDTCCPSECTPAELEEGGPRLLEILSRLGSPPPTVVVKRGRTHRDESREISAALRLGAFAVVDRPRDIHDLNTLLEVLRRAMARFYEGRWPRSIAPLS